MDSRCTPLKSLIKPFEICKCCWQLPERTYGEKELELLRQVLASGELGSLSGKFTPMFESRFASMVGTKFAVAMNSAMSVLHTSLLCADLGLEAGGEVICDPVFVFGAVAAMYSNLVPKFIDIDPVTHTLDPTKLEEAMSAKTKAVVVTHAWGLPADMDPILAIAHKHGALVVEDAAHAILATYKGRLTGSIGDIGSFSFQASKQMSLGDGGMATTNDSDLARKLDLHAGAPTFHSIAYGLHYNYRMNELTAAVGLAQLDRLPDFIEGLRKNTRHYDESISRCKWLKPQRADYGLSSYHFWATTFDGERHGISLARFRDAIDKACPFVSVGYTQMPAYRHPVIKERLAHIFHCGKIKATYPDGLCPTAEWVIPRMVLIYTLKTEEEAKNEALKLRQFIEDLDCGRI